MPEYLAPGVYVEETSFRAKSIEGVSTSTAAFVGPTRFGPYQGTPELITSVADYQRIYGDTERLAFGDSQVDNYVAQAVRAFFAEGGSRCYVMRTWNPPDDGDGHAQALVGENDKKPGEAEYRYSMLLKARYPGAAGQMEVTLDFRLGPNMLRWDGADWAFSGVKRYDTVLLCPPQMADPAKPDFAKSDGAFYWLDINPVTNAWLLKNAASAAGQAPTQVMAAANPASPPAWEARLVTVDVSVRGFDKRGMAIGEMAWPGFSVHDEHPMALTRYFAQEAKARATQLYVPLVIEAGMVCETEPSEEPETEPQIVQKPLDLWSELFGVNTDKVATGWVAQTLFRQMEAAVGSDEVFPAPDSFAVKMSHVMMNGTDGKVPTPGQYEGSDASKDGKTGLKALTDIDEISIVAAPGATAAYGTDAEQANADQVVRLLLAHCEAMRYRVAIIDAPKGQLVSEVRTFRSKFDSKYGALYYPWVQIMDPVTEKPNYMPPSGFVAGIYARNDAQTGVHKAPANEVVRLAMGFEATLNKAQQDVLNPEGINCFRTFPGTGHRLWGARTISSDPEWKYVSVRRYLCYLEHSIEKSTQWAVFMNNDENLWGNIQRTISDFLYTEWKNSRLFGSAPGSSYFVRCDRTTMTQNDLDNGRLVCLVGVCPVRPAEFVIFRVGQWTASA